MTDWQSPITSRPIIGDKTVVRYKTALCDRSVVSGGLAGFAMRTPLANAMQARGPFVTVLTTCR